MRLLRTIPLLALAALAGCDTPSGSGNRPVPSDELVFIRAAPDAPPLEAYTVSFWAVKGEDSRAELRYLPEDGDDEGELCLEFRLDDESLDRRPDGTRFEEGDSVLITVSVVDEDYFNFEFSPAGLRFSRDEPAELRVRYLFANDDYNHDGVVDEEDEDFDFGFWRQEQGETTWRRVGSAQLKDAEEIRADIEGFTKFAMAGN